MGYPLKRYIRKVSITRTFFQVVASTDELAYVGKANLDILGMWEVGKQEDKVIEPFRTLTEAESIIVANVERRDDQHSGWDSK